LRVAGAAGAGLFNAWAWLGIIRSTARRPAGRFRPVAPIGVAVIAGGAVAGIVIGMAGHGQTSRLREAAGQTPPSRRPVLIATGFASSWDGEEGGDGLPGFTTRRFSYRGLGPAGRPLPYTAADTHRSLPDLVGEMGRQVEQLHRESGASVDIVAE